MATKGMPMDEFENVSVYLFGCCSFEDTYHPGIKGWGETDEEARNGGYVHVGDYDRLLAAYKSAIEVKL